MRDFNRTFLAAAVLPVILGLAACQADYTDEALEKARDYTLENTRMLPEPSRDYVRYATPELQIDTLFEYRPYQLTEYGHIGRNVEFIPEKAPENDFITSNFVWNPPGLGFSIIALGHSQRNMQFWEPIKVIFKKPSFENVPYETARSAAIQYVISNMLYLSTMERVRVRFSEVEVLETDFDLEYMFEPMLEGGEAEWKAFLDSLKQQRDKKQFSLVWKADDPNKRIVIAGFGSPGGLEGWRPASGMLLTKKRLDEYVIGRYNRMPSLDFDMTGKSKK
ncbi:MAG: hypothetical protein BWY31_03617 [Lentisphaerae bacterium ADurb.Bin242]|nr:MAG: hypothetical protein BWY31_03617 [Lentisphaerae bacterium ADurb.Bin242]